MDCKTDEDEGKRYCAEREDVENGGTIVSEYKIYIDIIRLLTVAQSICTHYSSLSGLSAWYIFMVWNFKKRVQNMSCKKQGPHYSKREAARLPLLFLIAMALFFALCFLQPIFWISSFFQSHKLTHVFKTRISGCRLK